MSTRPTERKTRSSAKNGPVKPGTALYHVLELISREVAKNLEAKSPATDVCRPTR